MIPKRNLIRATHMTTLNAGKKPQERSGLGHTRCDTQLKATEKSKNWNSFIEFSMFPINIFKISHNHVFTVLALIYINKRQPFSSTRGAL